jgi:hypothetical protein
MDIKKKMPWIIGATAGFVNGLFGAAGGTVLVPCMERFLKYIPYKAHATAIAVVLPMCVLSGFIYMKDIKPDFKILMFIIAGGVVGGVIGAKLLKRISPLWLHRIFGIFMCIAAVKMIL